MHHLQQVVNVSLPWLPFCLTEAACSGPTVVSDVLQVKALEAAEAARKREEERAAERNKQRQEADKQRLERMKVAGVSLYVHAGLVCH